MSALSILILLALAGAGGRVARERSVCQHLGEEASLEGFLTRSRVVFEGHPDEPHALEAVYMLPDHVRYSFRRLDAPARVSEYRRGSEAYRFAPSAGASSLLERDERRALLLRMELRKAAMLWPNGFAWASRAPDEEARERACGVADPDPKRTTPLGELIALVDDEGRATTVTALIDGVEMERLCIDEWQSVGGRAWPLRLRLAVGDTPVWSESLETVRTDVFFTDLFFVPHDRRLASAAARADREFLSRDLVPMTYRAFALPEDCNWDAALDEARRLIARTRDELAGEGFAIDATPTIEISAGGQPLRVLVRLEGMPTPPPEGFTAVDERPGLIELVPSLAAVTPERVALLRRAVPGGQEAGTPYVRIVESERGPRVHLTLPLRAAH